MPKTRKVSWDILAIPMKWWLILAVVAQTVVVGMLVVNGRLGTTGSVLQTFAAASVVVIILVVAVRASRNRQGEATRSADSVGALRRVRTSLITTAA